MSLLPSNANVGSLLRTLLLAAAAVVILGGMHAISNILNAFLLAVLLGTVCLPLENWFISRGMNPVIAFLLTLVISVLAGVGTAVFIALSIFQVINQLPKYRDLLQSNLDSVVGLINSLGFTTGTITETAARNTDQIIEISVEILKSVASALGAIFLMYLFLFYILMEGRGFGERLRSVLKENDRVFIKINQFVNNARHYLVLRTVIGAIIASVQTVVMLLFGVDFALLWGFLSFICNYIPNVGFIIALAPPAILLFLEKGLVTTVIFIILYSISNNFIENFIAPKFIGVQVNLSPLTISVMLVFWTWVLGPLGALLALPMTLFVKGVLLETDSNTRVLAAMMSASSKDIDTPLVPDEKHEEAT